MTSVAYRSQETILEMKPYVKINQVKINSPVKCGDELMSLNEYYDYKELTNEKTNSQGQSKQGKDNTNE